MSSAPEPAASKPSDDGPVLKRFAQLLERTSQPFLAIDTDGRVTHANEAFLHLLGYTGVELTGLGIDELTPPDWRAATHAVLARLKATGLPQRYEKEYLHRDGHRIPVAMVTDHDLDERGNVRGTYAFVTDISDRKRAEEALRASERRFRELYDDAPCGYHLIDPEGTILSVNRTDGEILGYRREEMLGHSIFEFVAPDQLAEARRMFEHCLQADEPLVSVERDFQAKDGRRLTLLIDNRVLRDGQGRPVAIRSTVQDVTSRRQTAAALLASEKRLRALFEGIDDAIFVHDLDGRILDANPAASRKLGYSHQEFLRLYTSDIDDPDFAAGFHQRLDTQLERGHLTCEGRHRTKDGRVIPVDINTSTIQFDDHIAVLAVIRDITERKALEETRREFAEAQRVYARQMETKARALERSELRYRQLAESLLDALVVVAPGGTLSLFNPAAELLFGYRAEEVIGDGIDRLIPDDPAGRPVPSLLAAIRNGDARVVGKTVEVRGRHKDGTTLPLELSLARLEDEASHELVGSIRDLTERNRLRAVLMQTEKLASIGLLSAGVAHEINNPLAYVANNLAVLERELKGIVGLVEAYQQASHQSEPERDAAFERAHDLATELDWEYLSTNLEPMLQRTREGVRRVAGIVENLRGMARTVPPKLESAFLSDLIENALEMVQSRLKRSQIEVAFRRPELPRIACVPSQIGQVVLNLLMNAIQAIEQAPQSSPRWIAITIDATEGRQSFEVADTGIGIPPEDVARLFDPFFTTKPVGEGTGLGLAVSHGIVTGHGGTIDVKSAPGEGSAFRVSLPARTPATPAVPAPAGV
jgi:PAS domain S-box-containing protein